MTEQLQHRVEQDTKPTETRGQTFARLAKSSARHKIIIEAQWGKVSTKEKQLAEEGLATDRDEFRATFLGQQMTNLDEMRLQAFDAIVDMHVANHYRKEKEREEDWKLINKEFPNQFEEPDYDLLSRLGDVPPVVPSDRTLADLREHYGKMSKGFGGR